MGGPLGGLGGVERLSWSAEGVWRPSCKARSGWEALLEGHVVLVGPSGGLGGAGRNSQRV